MRDIKFRAWDKKEKCMWWNVQNTYDMCYDHATENPDDDPEERDFGYRSFGEALEDKNLIIMQYIGLKDKNGKEIYEGDIVEAITSYYHDIYKGTIVWDAPEFFCDGMYTRWGDERFSWDDVEVIGNIYENPELLEKVNDRTN